MNKTAVLKEQELLEAIRKVNCQADLIDALDLKINNLLDELDKTDDKVFKDDMKTSIDDLKQVKEKLINLE